MANTDIEKLIEDFQQRQDATTAAHRESLIQTGCSEDELQLFDAIYADVRARVTANIPQYVESIGAMIERDVWGNHSH